MFSFSRLNEEEYLSANPDVREAVCNGQLSSGLSHYKRYGKKEGRPLIKKLSRFDKVFSKLDQTGLGLEIGPSHNPIAPKKQGFNVHILDHASAEDLKKKYAGHGVNLDNIEEVDYIWSGETFEKLIGKKEFFDWIIASHVIEHVPDMIGFLNQCSNILKKDGKLSLVIPDKRYCFDYFSPLSTTGDFLDAYSEKRTRPTPGQVFDHFSNASKRLNNIAWSNDGLGGADGLLQTFSDAESEYIRSNTSLDYIDVHCWKFIPTSFLLIISDLENLRLIDFEVIDFYETDGCEFYVTLAKTYRSGKDENSNRFDKLIEMERELKRINKGNILVGLLKKIKLKLITILKNTTK